MNKLESRQALSMKSIKVHQCDKIKMPRQQAQRLSGNVKLFLAKQHPKQEIVTAYEYKQISDDPAPDQLFGKLHIYSAKNSSQ